MSFKRSAILLLLALVAMVAYTDGFGDETLLWTETSRSESPVIRVRKDASASNNCNTWSSWVNNNHPSASHNSEEEHWSEHELDSFCPSAVYGNITNMRCMDENGQTFTGVKQDVDNQWEIHCDDINQGVVCTPNPISQPVCQDLSVSYYCTCTPPTPDNTTESISPDNTTESIETIEGDAGMSDNQQPVCDELSDALLLKHSIPVYSSLLIVIILCLIIIAMLCKQQLKPNATLPTSVKPM